MKIQIIYLLLSFIFTACIGKIIIPALKKLKVGQNERADGPRSHLRKQGTPTMGGIMMIITIILFTIGACIINPTKEFIMPIIAIAIASIGFGVIGFIDDYLIIKRNNKKDVRIKQTSFYCLKYWNIFSHNNKCKI